MHISKPLEDPAFRGSQDSRNTSSSCPLNTMNLPYRNFPKYALSERTHLRSESHANIFTVQWSLLIFLEISNVCIPFTKCYTTAQFSSAERSLFFPILHETCECLIMWKNLLNLLKKPFNMAHLANYLPNLSEIDKKLSSKNFQSNVDGICIIIWNKV